MSLSIFFHIKEDVLETPYDRNNVFTKLKQNYYEEQQVLK